MSVLKKIIEQQAIALDTQVEIGRIMMQEAEMEERGALQAVAGPVAAEAGVLATDFLMRLTEYAILIGDEEATSVGGNALIVAANRSREALHTQKDSDR